jgi:hypothetical protein
MRRNLNKKIILKIPLSNGDCSFILKELKILAKKILGL